MPRHRSGASLAVSATVVLALASGCAPQDADESVAPGGTSGAGSAAGFDRLDGKPDLNGVWQVNNSANWNLEPHQAQDLPAFPELGAIAAIPPGTGFVEGGEIPYLAEALAKRDAYRASWPKDDPEANCYMPGIPRATYLPYPFEIVQGNKDILFAYEFATANRTVNMGEPIPALIPSWMGTSNGHWEGDTLVIEVTGNNDMVWYDRAGNYRGASTKVTERYTKVGNDRIDYSATIEDPTLYARPWTIRMPLYRRAEAGARVLELKCVPFAEQKIYGYLTEKDDGDSGQDE